MCRRWRGALWVVGAMAWVTTAAAEERVWSLAVGAAQDTLVVEAGQQRVCVSKRPVWVGSFVVRDEVRSYQLGVDYVGHPDEGCIELLAALPVARTIIVAYRYVPLTVPPPLRLHRRGEARPDIADPGGTAATSGVETLDAARLVVGGSKTFAVELGTNRDAVLRQSLDLTLRGQIARDVNVRAVLSDRDSPFTPRGTSAELDELDKVLIQLEAPNTRATFGDIVARHQSGEFARFDRQIEGAHAERDGDVVRVSGVVGNSRGEYRTVDFFGEEGRQGPYELGGLAGSTPGAGRLGVVPGTESVTLDGERLRRGQDRDYVIDYDLGELTFTPRRPISFDSRITVEFEEEADAYRRRLVSGETEVVIPGDVRVRTVFVSEGDDRGDPRGFSLTDVERAVLADVGDGDPVGEAFAVRDVGDGNGDYVRVDDGVDVYYEYRGPGGGNVLANFLRVGNDLGAYADTTSVDGDVYFIFVGEGRGEFDLGRRLARPERHHVGSLAMSWASESAMIEGEVAASNLDANTFSPFDDTDNDGTAGRARLEWTGAQWGNGAGGVTLRGRWRHLADDFRSLSRLTPSFDALDWNYAPGTLDGEESRAGLEVAIKPGDGGVLTLETGRLRGGDAFRADRAGIGYRRDGPVHVLAAWKRTWNSDDGTGGGRRDVQHYEAGATWRGIHPIARYRAEESRESADTTFGGNRFQQWGGELRVTPVSPLSIAVDASRRLDQDRARRTGDEWRRRSVVWDRGARVRISDWNATEAEAEFRRRELEPREGGEGLSALTTDLARVTLQLAPRDARVRFDYQVTTESVLPRAKNVIFVGEGLGTYDSLGVFVGTGDYTVDIEIGDEAERLSRLDLSLRGDVRRENPETAAWRQWRVSSFIRIRSLTRAAFADLVNPFRGRFYDDGANAVDGTLSMRHEVGVAPRARVTPRIRWERNRRVDGRFDSVRERREEDLVALEIRGVATDRWTVRGEAAVDRETDTVIRTAESTVRVDDEFRTLRGSVGATFKPSPAWSLGGDVGRERVRTDDVDETESRTEVTPVVAYAPPRWGRIELRGRRVWVSNVLPRRRPVFDFGLDFRSGTEWSLLADYRLRDYLTLGGTFRSVRPDGESSQSDGRLELRAFF